MYAVYVSTVMLTLLALAQTAFPVDRANQYSGAINPMVACHAALIRYVEANPGATGTIAPALVDSYLGAGFSDPGSFTYVVNPAGTAMTYLTVPQRWQAFVTAAIVKASTWSVVAGPVSGGKIIPPLPLQPMSVAGVPNGVVAIQTVVHD